MTDKPRPETICFVGLGTLVTSQYIEAHAHDEGGNGNQALFRVYDRMTNQVRDTPA
jgi:hypothetical protein